MAIQKNKTLGLFLLPCIRINSEYNRDYNVKIIITQVLEENIGEYLSNLIVGKFFYDWILEGRGKRLEHLLTLKRKSLCMTKTPEAKSKGKSHTGRKYLQCIWYAKNYYP